MPVRPSPPETTDHGTTTFKGQGFRLGIFDSGLGGLSILRAVRAALPEADLLYVADSGHAPYGERDDEFVSARSSAITAFLLDQGVDAVVVACNTATAAAVHHLREQWPHLPVIGVEPGVKPAMHQSANKRVGVLATPVTLASEKFATLVAQHGQHAHIVLQPCPGLAREIERGELDTPALRALVAQFSKPLLDEGVDTVALGCTHYPLVESLFRDALGPGVQIIDTSEAVARQVIRKAMASLALQAEQKEMSKTTTGATMLWSSGDPAHLSEVARCWLGLRAPAHPLSV